MSAKLTIHAFPSQQKQAERLAQILGIPCHPVSIHQFPDGESLVRVEQTSTTALVYCSLDHPNEKLVELLLAAQALRDRGAKRLVLIAPYMCYMRQDTAFEPGQAVSQHVIGPMLARRFDRIITIDPHLHRTKDISKVFPQMQTDVLSATELIAEFIVRQKHADNSIIFGPDSESLQWVSTIAELTGLQSLVAQKTRQGDRQVKMQIDASKIANRHIILIDDICASGGTLKFAVTELLAKGAKSVKAFIVHALCEQSIIDKMLDAGLEQFISTDSIVHPSNRIKIAPLLASALKGEK